MLGSVSIGLYGYGQPKPNISVCEILNRNRPKWLEINQFQCISVLVGFNPFSIFQREGYWDFQNPKNKVIEQQRERVVEQIRTTEKEKLPTIFVQQFTVLHTDSNKKLKIFWISKRVQIELYHCCTIAGAYHHAWAYHHGPWDLENEKKRKEWGGWTEKGRDQRENWGRNKG